jgi:hypothetical protein
MLQHALPPGPRFAFWLGPRFDPVACGRLSQATSCASHVYSQPEVGSHIPSTASTPYLAQGCAIVDTSVDSGSGISLPVQAVCLGPRAFPVQGNVEVPGLLVPWCATG